MLGRPADERNDRDRVTLMSTGWQVRLVWGAARALAQGADVVIIADASASHCAVDADDARRLVLLTGLDGAADAARRALGRQTALGRRASIVIAPTGDADDHGELVPTAADELVAGAVIDELALLGIDAHCPASAVACAAATTLHGALRSLVRADLRARGVLAD